MSAMDQKAVAAQSETFSETANQYKQQAAKKVSEISERVQSGINTVKNEVRRVDETTIPDAFRKVPKYISPRVHSWLDFAVTSYFVGLGAWFAFRGRGRAATAAFVNGAMVAGVSLLTDYDGDGRRPINFKMHGTLDAVQATVAALGPVLHGFADEPEAKYFWAQAGNEVGVIATTDWDGGMPEGRRLDNA
jgi:hypothetical protein